MAKKNSPIRLNIYVHDPDIRRQIKEMTARQDVSMSEYCLRAIKGQLFKEQKAAYKEENLLKKAVKRAQRFQRALSGKIFTISSADLIRESREGRST